MRRLRALMRKEFTHMLRDPRTLIFIFIMPVLQLLQLGYAGNNDIKNVPTVIFNQDNSQASRAFLDALRVTGYFSFDFLASSETDVNQAIEGGKAKVGIIIPPSYHKDLTAGRTAQVAVLIDGSDPTTTNAVLSASILVGQSQGVSIRTQQLANRGYARSGVSPLEVRTRVLYNPDMLSSYNMVPGLIAMILMMTTTNLTSLSIVKERERGTTIFVTTHYMDEAEHCNRVGFMHSGRLLAFDSPHDLKKHHLQGAAWALDVSPLLEAVEVLSGLPGIIQARLHGDQAQVIVAGEWTPESLSTHLSGLGLTVSGIETVEPTLEDVFTLLAHQ